MMTPAERAALRELYDEARLFFACDEPRPVDDASRDRCCILRDLVTLLAPILKREEGDGR